MNNLLEAIVRKCLHENSQNRVEELKSQLKILGDWFKNNAGKVTMAQWDEKEEESRLIRVELKELTGDYYGRSKEEVNKKQVEPNGVDDDYDHPLDVPIEVYRWIFKRKSLLTSDANDAVRWSRIINTKKDERYPSGEMTIYRAVDDNNYDEIRAGDWVTTEEKYATRHNKMYFKNKGVVISMNVDGRDVLVSPTGNYEEAIYAPIKLSIDVKV